MILEFGGAVKGLDLSVWGEIEGAFELVEDDFEFGYSFFAPAEGGEIGPILFFWVAIGGVGPFS